MLLSFSIHSHQLQFQVSESGSNRDNTVQTRPHNSHYFHYHPSELNHAAKFLKLKLLEIGSSLFVPGSTMNPRLAQSLGAALGNWTNSVTGCHCRMFFLFFFESMAPTIRCKSSSSMHAARSRHEFFVKLHNPPSIGPGWPLVADRALPRWICLDLKTFLHLFWSKRYLETPFQKPLSLASTWKVVSTLILSYVKAVFGWKRFILSPRAFLN